MLCRLTQVHQLKLHRCNFENTRDGRVVDLCLASVTAVGPGGSTDKSPRGSETVLSRIEVGAAFSPTMCRKQQAKGYGRTGVRGAHPVRIS